jgi:hypothetical protein
MEQNNKRRKGNKKEEKGTINNCKWGRINNPKKGGLE